MRRARILVRLVAGAVSIAGLLLVLYSAVWLALAFAGFAAGVWIPPRLRPARLLELDRASNRLVVWQGAAERGARIAVPAIRSLRGAYETQGWDPRSVVHAVLEDGAEVPVLVLTGTDERLAEAACRMLGQLLERPAEYTGPFGDRKLFRSPEAVP